MGWSIWENGGAVAPMSLKPLGSRCSCRRRVSPLAGRPRSGLLPANLRGTWVAATPKKNCPSPKTGAFGVPVFQWASMRNPRRSMCAREQWASMRSMCARARALPVFQRVYGSCTAALSRAVHAHVCSATGALVRSACRLNLGLRELRRKLTAHAWAVSFHV